MSTAPLERPSFTTQATQTYSLDDGEYIVRWYRGEDCMRQYITIQHAGAITVTLREGERVEVQRIEGGAE